MAIPVAAYMAGASLLGGLFTKRKKVKAPPPIDISGELAKLDALYGTQREMLTQDIGRQTGLMQQQTAQGLANRGILSSPVSEASFGKVRASGQQALAGGLADIYGRQAEARSAAMNSLLQYNQNLQQANYQRQLQQQQQQAGLRAGLFGMAGSFGLQALQQGMPRQQQLEPIESSYASPYAMTPSWMYSKYQNPSFGGYQELAYDPFKKQ